MTAAPTDIPGHRAMWITAVGASLTALTIGLTGCTSSAGSPATSGPAPGSSSTTSSGSSTVAPVAPAASEKTFTHITEPAAAKLEKVIPTLHGVQGVTYYAAKKTFVVYYKNASSKDRQLVSKEISKPT